MPLTSSTQRPANFTDDNEDSYRESCPKVFDKLSNKLSTLCSTRTLLNRFPILNWMPKYQKSYFLSDFIAGLSVGLTQVPQGMANAVVGGLPPQVGLYSGFLSSFVYIIFGSCKDITIGPSSIMGLMVLPYVLNYNIDFVILSTFLVGIVILLFGVLNLGFLVQFISTPIIFGFLSAGTLTIGSGQVKLLLGIKSGATNGFIDSWVIVFEHLNEIRYPDTILGLSCLLILIFSNRLKHIKHHRRFFKFLGMSKNAIIVIIGMSIAYIFHINGRDPFNLTGDVKKGIPPFVLPPFSTEINGNFYYFIDMIRVMGISLLTISIVSMLDTVAIAKSFSRGKIVNASQEMIACGLCNIFSSFVGAMPITASFTRSVINNASNVKTPLGGLYTGVIVLLALGLATQTFKYIPKCVLAALIINAMISMFELHEILRIYRTKRIDMIPFLGTFVVALLFGLEYGIGVGVLISLTFVLFTNSKPKIDFMEDVIDNQLILIVKSKQHLDFSSAEQFKTKILKHSSEAEFVIIDGSLIDSIDSTTAKIITSLNIDLSHNKKKLIFWNWIRDVSHVIIRYDRKTVNLFKSSENLKSLFHQLEND